MLEIDYHHILCLPHLVPISLLAIRNAHKVSVIMAGLQDGIRDKEVGIYLKHHHLKSALSIGVVNQISDAVGVPCTQDIEKASLYISILWSNLDKILDYLPAGDPRFREILDYYSALVLGNTPKPLSFSHPKFMELELIAREYNKTIQRFQYKDELLGMIDELIQAVYEQYEGKPQNIHIGSSPDFLSVKERIRNSGLGPEIQDAMFLSARLGISSVFPSFGVPFYMTGLEKNHPVRLLLIDYAAYMQFLDDFLDREKDTQKGLFTFAVAYPNEIGKIRQFISVLGEDLQERFQSIPTMFPKILLHGMNAYPILNSFGPKDNEKDPPYGIKFLSQDIL